MTKKDLLLIPKVLDKPIMPSPDKEDLSTAKRWKFCLL